MSAVHFTLEDAHGPVARELMRAMTAEIRVQYEGLDLDDPSLPRGTPAEFSPPGGGYVVGWIDGQPVAGGGFKRLDDEACEIKRMYVSPSHRGSGLGVHLLTALEEAAASIGYRLARLDTGPRQPRVARMYRDAGYRDVDNFNGNPLATFFGEKEIAPPPSPTD